MEDYELKTLEYRVYPDKEWYWEDAVPCIRFATEEEAKKILKEKVEEFVKSRLLIPFRAKYWRNAGGALFSEASRSGYLFNESLKKEYDSIIRDITMAHDFSELD